MIEQILLFMIALLLVALIFYISSGLVSNEWTIDAPFMFRLIVLSIAAVIVIPFLREIADEAGVGELGLLFAFVVLIFIVRYLLVEELPVSEDWLSAIVISFLGVLLIYVVAEIAFRFFDTRMLSMF